MERVFVYGLLRRGQSMAHMMARARFVGETEIDGFDLYHLGEFPGLVHGEGKVLGEVYELDSGEELAKLDAAERIDSNPPLYRRESVDALGSPTWIYVYARPTEGHLRIQSGDWVKRY
ncbi:MAG: gamma-glutamylcyclotransferase family protein [Planctomycetota bacterium]|jgi:gamma-glutamylcyclotransferase (GGCT)/AIG2-like uncharacterized protein YtfP